SDDCGPGCLSHLSSRRFVGNLNGGSRHSLPGLALGAHEFRTGENPLASAGTAAMNHWIEKLTRFWRMPLFTKLHALGTRYYKLKALLVYRIVFKEFGAGSYIRRPLLILNPAHISVGKCVGIRDGARLEVIRALDGKTPSLKIGDNTNIEQNVHIVCHSRIS